MDTLILTNAKKDIPLYLNEFVSFWQQTEIAITDTELVKCYLNTIIFKNWKLSLNHIGITNLNSILDEISEDINLSFYLAYLGQYRSAHMHLRSLIELSLQLLYFYQHEVEFNQWKIGEFRIKHEDLTNYLKKHPTLLSQSNENLINEITRKWKLFSKYIHAEAPAYFQTNLVSNQTNSISNVDFNIWKSNFLTIGYKLNKLFLIFYNDKINLFPSQTKAILLKNLTDDDIRLLGFEP